MKIYTKKGDKGYTSLIGGEKVFKADPRVEAYGTVDELTAFVGSLYDQICQREDLQDILDEQKKELLMILSNLMDVQAVLASDIRNRLNLRGILDSDIKALENGIDNMNMQLPAFSNFTLPCGDVLVSSSHICRTICRRAERLSLKASAKYDTDPNVLIYLNRLSDYLYILSRYISVKCEVEELFWKSNP